MIITSSFSPRKIFLLYQRLLLPESALKLRCTFIASLANSLGIGLDLNLIAALPRLFSPSSPVSLIFFVSTKLDFFKPQSPSYTASHHGLIHCLQGQVGRPCVVVPTGYTPSHAIVVQHTGPTYFWRRSPRQSGSGQTGGIRLYKSRPQSSSS